MTHRLLVLNPESRLGTGPNGVMQLQQHPWFTSQPSFSWHRLKMKAEPAPFIPRLVDNNPLTNYSILAEEQKGKFLFLVRRSVLCVFLDLCAVLGLTLVF